MQGQLHCVHRVLLTVKVAGVVLGFKLRDELCLVSQESCPVQGQEEGVLFHLMGAPCREAGRAADPHSTVPSPLDEARVDPETWARKQSAQTNCSKPLFPRPGWRGE